MKKWYLYLLAGLLCFALASCDKKDDPEEDKPTNYAPGEIPGLGDAEGELTGTPFRLPEGVELISGISGGATHDGYWDLPESYTASATFTRKDGSVVSRSFAPQTRAGEVHYYFGSGAGYVDLLIPMRNTKSNSVTVTFPAATVLRSESGNCQNGVLLKKVSVTIPGNSDYYLRLAFYCGNAHKSGAGGADVYELGVVSDAKPLLDLCERLKNKKINIEEFTRTSYDDCTAYGSQVSDLQGILWKVTDDTGLEDDDIRYINALPNSQ